MNAKAKGNRNEHRSMAVLEAAGYACTRSAAFGNSGLVLCSLHRKRSATCDLFISAPANCRKLVHRWRPRQRTPDVREL